MALSLERALLRLKRMEAALIRSQLAQPDILPLADYELLRYALVLGRLQAFTPGVAGRAQQPTSSTRPEVLLDPAPISLLRELLLEQLYVPLREQRNIVLRLTQLKQRVATVKEACKQARETVLAKHAADFSADELDAELCHKVLVLAPGGGGGSGFVYIGLVARLQAAGIRPTLLAHLLAPC